MRNTRPNIIFILADDMGYGDPGCFNPESKTPTPHIDRLAAQGMRFTDAHAPGSWCVPSRYGLLTGRYPMRETMDPGNPIIEDGRMTIGSLLQKNGYRTACIGKWHLGFEGGGVERDFSTPMRGGPYDRGFDSYFGLHASLDIPPYYYIEDDRCFQQPTEWTEASHTPGWTDIQGAFWREGKIAPDFKHAEVLPLFAEKAVRFIGDASAGPDASPFFLYFPMPAPHTPWLPTDPFLGAGRAGEYGDFVAQVDDVVGQVVNAVEAAGIADDTLIFFTSDNGPVWYEQDVERWGHRSVGRLRGMKSDSWEGAHRMPFVARWPGRIPAGTECGEMICFTDMLATFADIVGEKLPPGAGEDSQSILPALLGRERDRPVRETMVIWNNVIRRGEWKLILGDPEGGLSRRVTGRKEKLEAALYNLREDPSETTNLYAEKPELAAELKALLEKYKRDGRSAPA